METRKRTKTRDGEEGNKRKSSRKSRKSKTKAKSTEEKNTNEGVSIASFELDANSEDADATFLNELNTSSTSEIIQACCEPYREEYDKKVINYFKDNMHLLALRDDLSVYDVIKVKYVFQKSAKSLRARFLNVILPNLFKYDVLDHSEIIDFYDAAKMELPDELIAILNEPKALNKTNRPVRSVQKESVAISDKSSQSGDGLEGNCAEESASLRNEDISIAGPSRLASSPDREIERYVSEEDSDSDSEVEDPPAEKCLKSVFDFILLEDSEEGDCLFIPERETDVGTIENRLWDEFQIRRETIRIVPNDIFAAMEKLKDAYDRHDLIVNDFMKKHTYNEPFAEKMLSDSRQLLEFLTEKSNTKNTSVEDETTACLFCPLIEDIDIKIENNLEDLPDAISPGSGSFLAETVKLEVVENENEEEREDVQLTPIQRSPILEDHTYFKHNNNTSTPNNNPKADDVGNISPTSSIMAHACMPQIMFSQRSKHKIINEHINVDHLLVQHGHEETLNANHSNDTQLSI